MLSRIYNYPLPRFPKAPLTKIRHFGVVAEDGVSPEGTPLVAGSVIACEREVTAADALHIQTKTKQTLHRVMGHRRSVHTCREAVCGDVQNEIDRLTAVTVN